MEIKPQRLLGDKPKTGDGTLLGDEFGLPEVPIGPVRYKITQFPTADGVVLQYGELEGKKVILDKCFRVNNLVLRMADSLRVPIKLEEMPVKLGSSDKAIATFAIVHEK